MPFLTPAHVASASITNKKKICLSLHDSHHDQLTILLDATMLQTELSIISLEDK
jgi:hypothetical protein